MKSLDVMMLLLCMVSTAFAESINSPTPEEQATSSQSEMVFVKGGCFDMGRGTSEHMHRVCLSDFYIDKFEVTQNLYEKATGTNPAKFGGCPECPVERVTWDEAKAYCKQVGKRLLTEAEWEYAARSRGGKKELSYAGTQGGYLKHGWLKDNSGGKTHPVGQLKPNELGLYDMSGNVEEWVSDNFSRDYYLHSPEQNPQGAITGDNRVVRGGSWNQESGSTTQRNDGLRDYRIDQRGFRCAGDQIPNAIKSPSPVSSKSNEDLKSKLEKTKKAFDDGIITEEEYKAKRSQIIKEF